MVIRLSVVCVVAGSTGLAASASPVRPLDLTPDPNPRGVSTDPEDNERRVRALIDDLADDRVAWNCNDAIQSLQERGDEVTDALEDVLTSMDEQQRQCAAHILRRLSGYEPTHVMLSVCVEGLRSDGLPSCRRDDGEYRYTGVYNAAEGTRYLAKHAMEAEPLLVAALKSDDEQQRFLAAVVLGWAGCSSHAPASLPVLLHHLCDNDQAGDATLAACAISRFGSGVLPLLALARERPEDEQQSSWLDLIVLDLEQPPQTPDDFKARRGMVGETMADDPIASFDNLEGFCIGLH